MNFFKVSGAFLLLCVAISSAAPSEAVESNEVEPQAPWERISRMLSDCAIGKEDMMSCVAVKGVSAINRAARMQDIELFSGVHFERDPTVSIRDGKSFETESDIARSLPSDPTEKASQLLKMAMESAGNFLSSHNLQVKLAPEELASAARTFNEARGKMKKMLGPILLGVGVKILAVVAIFGGGLVLLVTKALIVAKLAFVLASILGLQKLFSSGGGAGGLLGKVGGSPILGQQAGWSNAGVSPGWSSGSGAAWSQNAAQPSAAYPYARSYETQEAQDQAYAAQKPAQV